MELSSVFQRRRLAVLSLSALCITSSALSRAETPAPASDPGAASSSAFAKLPLHFEANQGQTHSSVRFLARGQGYSLFLTPSEAVFNLRQGTKAGEVLRMQLAGANSRPAITGQSALPGKINYFMGKDPSKWRTGLPTFAKVQYQGVYPGVNLVYYGNQRQLEYDFVVSPGADPKQIGLTFAGAKSAQVDKSGDLVLGLSGGKVRWQKPVIYQEVNGKRVAVAGKYALRGQRVGFQIARYDKTRPLVIDPVLAYSTYLGGANNDNALDVAVDGAGSAYVVGNTTSGTFPVTNGTVYQGGQDALVAKLNPSGSSLVYATFIGGTGSEVGDGIAVDSAGSAYVTGWSNSSAFPTTTGAYQTSNAGSYDAFVAKLSADGSSLVYATLLGGSGEENGRSIAVDTGGNAYVAGRTFSSNFPTTAGAAQTVAGGGQDAFVTKVSADGASVGYSTLLGGTGNEHGIGIAVDAVGSAYVAARVTSSGLATAGAAQTIFGGVQDAFAAKLSADGSIWTYATYLGGTSDDGAFGIAIDSWGSAYITGWTYSSNFPVTGGAYQTIYGGGQDAFVAKVSADGSSLAYATFLGGSGQDLGIEIAVNAAGNALVTGQTNSASFPTTASAFQGSLGGGQDAFLSKLSLDGASLLFSTYLGGSANETGNAIATDTAGNPYVVGVTASSDYLVTPDAYDTGLNGASDGFVTMAKLFSRYDFNGDDKLDLLFQNQNTGTVSAWFMDGVVRLGAAYIYNSLDLNVKVVASGDFNADDKTDLVTVNHATGVVYLSYLNGTTLLGSPVPLTTLPAGRSVVGAADLNRDGQADLILQDDTTGATAVWYYVNGQRIGVENIYPTPAFGSERIGVDWKIVANGDFNGDGKPDLIFQNAVTGGISCWFLDGATLTTGVYIVTSMANWKITGTRDVNGDGKPDLIFQNPANGVISVWFMDGTTRTGAAYFSSFPGADWKAVGIR